MSVFHLFRMKSKGLCWNLSFNWWSAFPSPNEGFYSNFTKASARLGQPLQHSSPPSSPQHSPTSTFMGCSCPDHADSPLSLCLTPWWVLLWKPNPGYHLFAQEPSTVPWCKTNEVLTLSSFLVYLSSHILCYSHMAPVKVISEGAAKSFEKYFVSLAN